MSSNRLKWLDMVRGIAIVSVVIAHVANMYYDHGMFQIYSGLFASLSNIMDSFMMALFFITSGFSFSISAFEDCESGNKGFGKLKKHKVVGQIVNLLILYFAWSILYCLLKNRFAGEVLVQSSISDILWLPLKAQSLFWYLYVLICCYIVVVIFIKFKLDLKKMIMVGGILSIVQYWITIDGRSEWTILIVSRYLIFFLLGILLSKQREYLKERIKFTTPLFMIICGGIIEAVYWRIFMADKIDIRFIWSGIPAIGIIIPLFIATGIFLSCMLCKQSEKELFIVYLGQKSLEIYLLHRYVMMALKKILQISPINNGILVLILNTAFTIVGCLLLALVFEKIKLGKLIFKPWRTINEIKNKCI